MGFSRQEQWSGLHALLQGIFSTPGMKPVSLTFPALTVGFFTTSTTWEALCAWYLSHITNVITPTHTSAVPCTCAHPFLSLVIHIYTIYICFQLQIITERSRTKIAARPVWFYNSHLLSAAGPSRRVGKDFPRAQTGRFLRASISMPLNSLSTTSCLYLRPHARMKSSVFLSFPSPFGMSCEWLETNKNTSLIHSKPAVVYNPKAWNLWSSKQ